MSGFLRAMRFPLRRRAGTEAPTASSGSLPDVAALNVDLPIDPDDPLVVHLEKVGGVVDVDELTLESPALRRMREAGVKLVVPLVSQGELIGLLNLGARRSEQQYSSDDRRLLDTLAGHAAPAVRVAQLVHQHEAEAKARESIQQELRIAHMIQQALLPKRLPELADWQVDTHYQPARAVGGDFYDFIDLPKNRIGIVIGDASGKGVPAALVMATTRTMLRASAPRLDRPGKVLERVNESLCTEIPPNMFVTCLYAVLEPDSGRLSFANAGHNLPYLRESGEVVELRAKGWPLGLMPGTEYEEHQAVIEPGGSVLLYSDGIVEAHTAAGDMFGFDRLKEMMFRSTGDMCQYLLDQLSDFTGAGYEQEDDITLVELHRVGRHDPMFHLPDGATHANGTGPLGDGLRLLDEFTIASEPGNERLAMAKVASTLATLNVGTEIVERMKTAVAEATMNAIEHGNRNHPELLVTVRIFASDSEISVQVVDQGGSHDIPEPDQPDLDAKLAGLQSPRGWGLFLIRNMVDEVRTSSDGQHHTIELILNLKGGHNGN
jgi:serine phosphatase RsbU (regulator of sigma subunit)/anti-sigma regulatory factor (Ser/Thr protein kinase)